MAVTKDHGVKRKGYRGGGGEELTDTMKMQIIMEDVWPPTVVGAGKCR